MTRERSKRARRLSKTASARKSQIRIQQSRIHSALRAPRSAFVIELSVRRRLLGVNRAGLTRLARSVLEREQVAKAEISVAIVDDAQIHAINRHFLGHDYPTDVVSFLLNGEDQRRVQVPAAEPRRRGAGKSIDGEIILSAETALRNAARYRVAPDRELALYLVHGLLHLCGYDDTTAPEKRVMRRREAEALAGLE
jgi:probable rRNA maturation factor